jgi:hypothetical protein
MVHLLLFNEKIACGAEGKSSSLIQLVNCGRCHAWHNANEFARSMMSANLFEFDDEEPIELVVCSCGCREVCPKAQAKWDEGDSLPYISYKHMADHQRIKERDRANEGDAFEEANADLNARLYAEHRDRNDGQ